MTKMINQLQHKCLSNIN